MAVAVWRYYTVRITRWRRLMAFLKATKRRHWVSTCSDNMNRTCPPQFIVVHFIVKSSKMLLSQYNNLLEYTPFITRFRYRRSMVSMASLHTSFTFTFANGSHPVCKWFGCKASGPINIAQSFRVCHEELRWSVKVAKVFGHKLAENVVGLLRIVFKPENRAPWTWLVKWIAKKHDDMQIVDDILIRYGQNSVITAIKSHTDVSTAIVEVFIETILWEIFGL